MLRAAILIGALGAGGAAAWIATTMTTAAPTPTVTLQEPQATVEVLVSAAPVNIGAVLKQDDMRWQAWPEESLVEGYVTRAAQPDAPANFAGQMTRTSLATGEPIRAERLVRGEGGILSVMLTTGKRAVAVRTSAQSAAGGFIMPGDRVDVVRTYSMPNLSNQARMISETILRNIRVLAIDQATENVGDGTALGQTATLELDAEQVESVVAGEAMGLLSLSLRSFEDNDDAPSVIQIAPPVETPTQTPPVRIFRGGVVEQVELR